MSKDARDPRLVPRQDIAFALTGLGGSNAFGAGFLQAALDCRIEPKIVTCTSGMIYWTWRYLEALRTPEAARSGVLRREVEELIRRAEPFPKAAGLMNSFWMMSVGVPGVFRWARPEQIRRFFFTPLFGFGVEFPKNLLDVLMPAQVLVPTRAKAVLAAMAEAFNDSEIGICFNSLMAGAGTEYLHVNRPAHDMLQREQERKARSGVAEEPQRVRDAAKWRSLPTTVEAQINVSAIEDAMWLTLYGPHGSNGLTNRIDGAYLRSIILSELTMVDTVLMPRPVSIQRSNFPSNYFEAQDFQTELWWNASYAPQVSAINFVNRLVDQGLLPTASFRHIDLIPVEIDVDRGYFTYFREDLETFDRGYNETYATFEKAGLLDGALAAPETASAAMRRS